MTTSPLLMCIKVYSRNYSRPSTYSYEQTWLYSIYHFQLFCLLGILEFNVSKPNWKKNLLVKKWYLLLPSYDVWVSWDCCKIALQMGKISSFSLARRGGAEVAGWTLDRKIRVRFPAYPHRVWALWWQGGKRRLRTSRCPCRGSSAR